MIWRNFYEQRFKKVAILCASLFAEVDMLYAKKKNSVAKSCAKFPFLNIVSLHHNGVYCCRTGEKRIYDLVYPERKRQCAHCISRSTFAKQAHRISACRKGNHLLSFYISFQIGQRFMGAYNNKHLFTKSNNCNIDHNRSEQVIRFVEAELSEICCQPHTVENDQRL